MSEPTKNETSNAAVEEPKALAHMSLRRKQAKGIAESESKVERPDTVPVFRASPTSVAGALAKHGVSLAATLAWGQAEEAGAAVTKSPASAPLFIVAVSYTHLTLPTKA